MTSHRLKAFNTATESTNKIHDDAVARTLGFRGGLVPGVDVFAYLCHLPAQAWGADWLAGGTIHARFATPVYDGDEVEIIGEDVDGTMALELRDSSGAVCATGTARRAVTAEPIDVTAWPVGPVPVDPPSATADGLTDGSLGYLHVGFHADRAGEYLDWVREDLPLFCSGGIAHPGWLLRWANYVLSSNVRLGPWIHVESDVHLLAPVHDGQTVETRAIVNRVWESKGHELVELDVLQVVSEQPVTRTTHTAIFRPRGVRA
jgi:acyl dehydratase